MARLTPDQWKAIRAIWKYNPDVPIYTDSMKDLSDELLEAIFLGKVTY